MSCLNPAARVLVYGLIEHGNNLGRVTQVLFNWASAIPVGDMDLSGKGLGNRLHPGGGLSLVDRQARLDSSSI